MRTLNGEILIDEKSKLNEQTWLNSCIAVGELLAELYSDKEGADDGEMA